MADHLELKKGMYLVREGEESTHLYYLQKGMLAVLKLKGGVEVQIGTIYAGEVVGEMSFLDKEPRSASVQAIDDCELTVIPAENFNRLLGALPKWYTALINTLLDRLRKANARIKI
jgi:CRP/FNR family transcriptional regulator, cyclic AMP receptor protein